MMRSQKILSVIILIIITLFFSCSKEQKQVIPKPYYELWTNTNIPKFDSENAYNQISAQVEFGPRDPGSAGHQNTLNYLLTELKKYADVVNLQNFSYQGYDNVTLSLTNIIAKFNPGKKNRILFCAHWDTRPRAEHAVNPALRDMPILGANDGASGCGVLLELARLLKSNNVNYGIDLVFFDGEDYGQEHDLNNFCLGSKYFAVNNSMDNIPAFCVLLDLVGDKQASFDKEGNSEKYAGNVVGLIWGIAQQLNEQAFSQDDGAEIYDDHIPMIQAGLTTVDIIDADLVGAHTDNKRRNYWHSENDNMNNISKETLQQVGDVLTNLIYSIHFNS